MTDGMVVRLSPVAVGPRLVFFSGKALGSATEQARRRDWRRYVGLMAAIYILIHGVQTKSTKSKGSDKDLQDSNYLRRDLWSLWRMKWDQPHNLMREERTL